MDIYDISSRVLKGVELVGESIDYQNKGILKKIIGSDSEESILVGVKNNRSIPRDILEKLFARNFFYHTIDRASDRGRAMDTTLENPITGMKMSGSSSGTAINVLYGINHIGIGTDGGGSVIYPAISLNLSSLMGKGMGIKSNRRKISTDGIPFEIGLGFISHDLSYIEKAIENILVDREIKDLSSKDIRVLVKKGIEERIESRELKENISKLKDEYKVKEISGSNSYERERLLEDTKEIFKEGDIFIAYEEKVDVDITGDTLGGHLGLEQNKSNKRYGKICNMANLTAITIPDTKIGSGIIIMVREGVELGLIGLEIGKKLSIEMTPLYKRYFERSYLDIKEELIFEI